MPLPGADAKKEVQKRNTERADRTRKRLGIIDPFARKWKPLQLDKQPKEMVKT